jgi:endonuclease I
MKYIFILLTLLFGVSVHAQIPQGYYDSADGLTGDSLRQALHDIIDNHTVVSYGSLWTHFQKTDVKSNGKVWDIYSDIPNDVPPYEYTFVNDQCGSYSAEGDCYNREHSFPKSWFGSASPMYTDMFHLYPTDGYVNGMRSNHPYGEVSNPTWTSQNGSKRGPNTYPGYSGTVFEPIYEYRGDLARTYFYMVTRYMDQTSSWSSPMLSGDDLSAWALNLLMDWHSDDPVDQKEIDRNDSIYTIQSNRNPFIDNPDYVAFIYDPTISIESSTVVRSYVSQNVFYFKDEGKLAELMVFSADGQLIQNFKVPANRLDLGDLEAGMYVIVYSTDEGRSKRIRFIVN